MELNLCGRTAIYREAGEFSMVEITQQKDEDWGVILTLKIKENKFARENDDDELVYYSKEKVNHEFTVSGAWDVVFLSDDIFRIAYVGVSLNLRQGAIEAFMRNEIDVYELWNKR